MISSLHLYHFFTHIRERERAREAGNSSFPFCKFCCLSIWSYGFFDHVIFRGLSGLSTTILYWFFFLLLLFITTRKKDFCFLLLILLLKFVQMFRAPFCFWVFSFDRIENQMGSSFLSRTILEILESWVSYFVREFSFVFNCWIVDLTISFC